MFSFCVPRIAAAPSHTMVPGAIRHRVQLWTPPAPGPETKPCLAPDSGPAEGLDLGLTHTAPATLCAPHNGAPKPVPNPDHETCRDSVPKPGSGKDPGSNPKLGHRAGPPT